MSKIGRYMAMRKKPTMPPRKTIISGSSRLVKADTARFEGARFKVHRPAPSELLRRYPEIPCEQLPATFRVEDAGLDEHHHVSEIDMSVGVESTSHPREVAFLVVLVRPDLMPGVGGANDEPASFSWSM